MSKYTSSPTTSMKGLVAGCIIKILLASIITLLFQVSLASIATGVGTQEIGYRVLYSADNNGYEEVYLHLYADGEDTRLAQYQNDPHYYKVAERSKLNSTAVNTINWVACAFGLLMLYFGVYSALWRAGDALSGRAEFGKQNFDRWFGLKVGLFTEIPFFILYIVMVVGKFIGQLNYPASIYKIVHYFCFPYTNLFITKINDTLQISSWGLLALFPVLFIVPLICMLGYQVGSRHFVLKNALIYGKSKGE